MEIKDLENDNQTNEEKKIQHVYTRIKSFKKLII